MLALVIFLFLIAGLGFFFIFAKKSESYWHGPRWGRRWAWEGGWNGWRREAPAIYSDKDFVLLSEKDCIEFGCEKACREDSNSRDCKECKLGCLQV